MRLTIHSETAVEIKIAIPFFIGKFVIGKPPCFMDKLDKPPFFISKPQLSTVKPPFFSGKSPLFTGEAPFFTGKPPFSWCFKPPFCHN